MQGEKETNEREKASWLGAITICGANGSGCIDVLASAPNRGAQKPLSKDVGPWGIRSVVCLGLGNLGKDYLLFH